MAKPTLMLSMLHSQSLALSNIPPTGRPRVTRGLTIERKSYDNY